VTAVLLFLLLTIVTSHRILRVDATTVEMTSGEQTWTYPLYNLENFTIIVLPDTQYYSEACPDVFDNQTQWIVDNKETLNIIFVTHLGDIVDEWDDLGQWDNANRSFSMLDGNVPYGVLAGNHDGVGPDQTNFEKYLGQDRFSNESGYGGAYQSDNKNSWQLFSAGGDDYLILHLQYDPSDSILAWANDIIDNHPTRRVVVSTHEYVAWPWDGWRSPIGERIWQKLVKPYADQIFLILCGHVDVEDHRTATADEHVVYELVSDYQEQSNGGNGWLKILEFSPLQDKIFVKTYSPYLGRFENDSDNQFTLDYDMTSTQANITVLSNSTLTDYSFDWSSKQISFRISGETDTTGYCNVSIPLITQLERIWSLQIDVEKLQRHNLYQNATHTGIYFEYTHSSILQVTIKGAQEVSEFTPATILPLFVIATLIAIIFSNRKLGALLK
jgi:hypothetical protein